MALIDELLCWFGQRLISTQAVSGEICALFSLLIQSWSAMDKHMQLSVFHTIAFFSFSCPAFSTPASWCRKFMSRILSVPVHGPQDTEDKSIKMAK